MAVCGLGADKAFESLVWVSQHANVKVCHVAEQFLAEARGSEFGPLASLGL